MNTVVINGVEYAPITAAAEKLDGMEYKIVRTYSAGVFAGYLEKREGREVTLRHARRIWYWEGACSLSQLAINGTAKPESCKFPAPVDKVLLLEAIEILDVTEKAKQSIEAVKEWKYE